MAGRFSIEAIFKATDRLTAPVRRMQASVGKLVSSARKDFSGLEKETTAMAGRVTSGALRMAKVGAVAGAAAGAVGLGLGKAAVDAEAFRENTLRALTLITQDAQKAGEVFTHSLDIADRLGTGPEDTIQSIQRLMAKGFGEEQALKTFAGLADLKVVIPTANLENAVLAIEQIKSKGVLQMEELQGQLAEAGLNVSSVLEAIGQKIGKSQKEVRKLISAGKITADQGIEGILGSIQTLTGKPLGAVSEEASRGLSGTLSRMGSLGERFFLALSQRFDATPLKARFAAVWQAISPSSDPFEAALGLAARGMTRLVGVADRALEVLRELRTTGLPIAEAFGAGLRIGLGAAASEIERLAGPLVRIFTDGRDWVVTARDLGAALGRIGVYAPAFVAVAGGIWAVKTALTVADYAARGAGLAFAAFEFTVKGARAALMFFSLASRIGAASALALSFAESAARLDTWRATAASVANTASSVVNTAVTRLRAVASRALGVALAIARLATTKLTLATIIDSIKSAANTAITWGRRAAQFAYNVVAGAGARLVALLSLQTGRLTLKSIASTAWTWSSRAAQIAYNAVLGIGALATQAYAAATGEATAATLAAETALAPLLVTLAAVAAAIAALVLAWKAWQDLDKQTGGLGVGGTIGKMIEMGTLDPFKAIDAHMNEQARLRSEGQAGGANGGAGEEAGPAPKLAPQVVSSTTSLERVLTESISKAEVTIKDETERAEVTEKPKSGAMGLRLTRSGAL